MRRFALVILALAIVGIGAGMFVWLSQTPVAAAKTQPISAPSDVDLTQNTNAAPQNSTDIVPASSMQYDSSAEEELTIPVRKTQGHHCDVDGSASMSGY
jgi:hypothetical protein